MNIQINIMMKNKIKYCKYPLINNLNKKISFIKMIWITMSNICKQIHNNQMKTHLLYSKMMKNVMKSAKIMFNLNSLNSQLIFKQYITMNFNMNSIIIKLNFAKEICLKSMVKESKTLNSKNNITLQRKLNLLRLFSVT